jgi:3-hydroxyisobutyrate dehydrogenase-like beta-hydroxyacid dehydrogenase
MAPMIGVIGLGVMGMPIARNMVAAGLTVTGFDIEPRAMAAFMTIGGTAASSAGELTARCDVILTLLPSVDALNEVVSGPNGLLAAGAGTPVIAECSTLPIAAKLAARDRLAASGITMLDCPLSGTGVQAETGDLVVFGSGSPECYEFCLPAFRAMSRVQHHLGAFGNGSRMKFVANHLVNIHNVAAAEAMVLGMKAGLDPAIVYQVIAGSAGTSRMFEVRAPMMAAGNYSAVSMALGLWRKDIETIASFAADVQCPVPLFVAASQPYYAALAQGLGELDTAAVCTVLEEAARVVRTPQDNAHTATKEKPERCLRK